MKKMLLGLTAVFALSAVAALLPARSALDWLCQLLRSAESTSLSGA